MILVLRTDKPEAEVGLYEGHEKRAYHIWTAHRALAETLHTTIHVLLQAENLEWDDVKGVVVFEGPGSFTGLRIGISVANALGNSLQVPVVGAQTDDWITIGIKKLESANGFIPVTPEYGAPAFTTTPRK